jgi:hypothetical protein
MTMIEEFACFGQVLSSIGRGLIARQTTFTPSGEGPSRGSGRS